MSIFFKFRWDPITRTWSYVASMSFMRSTAGVAVLNNRLYVCGGRDGSSCHRSVSSDKSKSIPQPYKIFQSQVECYDPHTNKWTLRAAMNYRRSGVGVGVLNGYLYAVGGHDIPASNPSVCRTETVERYDIATDTWTLVKHRLLFHLVKEIANILNFRIDRLIKPWTRFNWCSIARR